MAFGGVQAFNLGTASGTIGVTGTVYAGSYPSNTASYVPLTWSLTGALGGNVVLQIPSGVGGQWIIENNTTAAYTVTVSSAGGGTTVVIPQTFTRCIFSDGTNVAFADQQTTTAASTTQVIYNSSGALTGSANLIFDGTTLTANKLAVSSTATVGGALTGSSTIQSAILILNPQSAAYPIASTDSGAIIAVTSASPVIITIPTGLSAGFRTMVLRLGAGSVTIAGAAGMTINSRTGAFAITQQYGSASILLPTTTTAVIDGNI